VSLVNGKLEYPIPEGEKLSVKVGKGSLRTGFVILHIIILSVVIYTFSNFNKYLLIGILNVLCPIITFVMLWCGVNGERLLEKILT
jgi:hypothetical protein